MAKIAALYGDSATLISLKAKSFEVMRSSSAGSFMEWDITRMRNVAGGEIVQVFDEIEAKMVELNNAIEQLRSVEENNSRQALRKNAEYIKIKKMLSNPDKLTAVMRAQMNQIFKEYGFDQIEKLTSSGFLNILSDDEMGMGSEPSESFFSVIFDIFNGDSMTYPLFDDDVSNIVRLGVNEGKISLSEAHSLRSKQISLPADFLERLPNFSNATIKEVLDIRKVLRNPLVRFRSAIIDYSEQVKNSPWDKDFKHEAEILFRKEIAPTILEIEEAIEENSIRKHILRNTIANGVATGVLSFVVSNIDAFTDILGKSGSSLLGAGLGAAGKITGDYQAENSKINKNGMYFLYKTNQLLSR